MTKDKLKKRITKIYPTKRDSPIEPLNNNRRGKNHVSFEVEESLSHDDFFDFEKDLIDLKSSRNLAANAPGASDFFTTEFSSIDSFNSIEPIENNNNFIIMEKEKELTKENNSIGIILEENDIEDNVIEEKTNNNDNDSKTSFEFIQCEAIKSNGERCKRQAPNNFKTCSIASHRKQEFKS